jgi:hypothetical protein
MLEHFEERVVLGIMQSRSLKQPITHVSFKPFRVQATMKPHSGRGLLQSAPFLQKHRRDQGDTVSSNSAASK